MHYCLMLFTKDCPSEKQIEDMMKKYNSEDIYADDKEIEYPQFTYDWYQIGGRYNGSLKLKINREDETYRWGFFERNPRNGRLLWSYLLNQMEEFSEKSIMYSEEDYFCSMGANDGFLYVDGARIGDTLNFDEQDCYTFMTSDGEAYSREWWNGNDFIPNDDFEERLKSAKEKAKEENQFVTIIDYHD